jgi:hypothetical protein
MGHGAGDRLIVAEIAGITPATCRCPARTRSAKPWQSPKSLSLTQLVDQLAAQLGRPGSLAARAGADMGQVAQWIPVRVKRGEDIQACHGQAPRPLA